MDHKEIQVIMYLAKLTLIWGLYSFNYIEKGKLLR